MKQKGRKSTAKLSIISGETLPRPAAPDDLLPDERLLWDAITSTRMPDFFDVATLPLLSEYCRLKTRVDLLAEQLEDFDSQWLATEDGVKRYKSLAGCCDQAQGRMISLARTMRLTQQSRYVPDKQAAKPIASTGSTRLWHRD